MRVLFLNDYSIEYTFKQATNDVDHMAHTWGYDYFTKRCETTIARIKLNSMKWQRRCGTYSLVGDLLQEWQVVKSRSCIDVVISGNLSVVSGLNLFRTFVKIPPTIAILHSIPHHGRGICSLPNVKTNRLARLILLYRLSKIDRIICIAQKEYVYLTEVLKIDKSRVYYIPWSANCFDYDRALSDYSFTSLKNEHKYIVSMGKSERDFPVLMRAFKDANIEDLELKIYKGSGESISDGNIKVIGDWVNFKTSVHINKSAQFVIVPLVGSERTLGLTSLFDAMAVGKAVIMTRNPGVDIDIEKERIGYWVEPGDVKGMADKIKFLSKNPQLAEEMGKNGRDYLERRYTYNNFCEKLYEVAVSLHEEKNRGDKMNNRRANTVYPR